MKDFVEFVVISAAPEPIGLPYTVGQVSASLAELAEALAGKWRRVIDDGLSGCLGGQCSLGDIEYISELMFDAGFIPPNKDSIKYNNMTAYSQKEYIKQLVMAYAVRKGFTIR